ncbi:hypothetical protein EG341_16375 [Chryseobacterium lactis]|nr:hypothetical protein [Chryseobacterium lactis]AZA80443.1 hypothetical protein EG342_00250 [Chryseobacterium lactis]AZB05445.1 hypothetical protein EG341_16375 [Chryseobacterium lactis]
MKKIITLLSLVAMTTAYAQGTLIINNYSAYDFYGHILAFNMTSPCYPRVANNLPITVPANSNTGNGNQLQYDNYRDQFTTSLYPQSEWTVSSSPNITDLRPWNFPLLDPASSFAASTKWGLAKFGMVYAGTHNNVPNFSVNIAVAGNPCYNSPVDYTTPNGANYTNIFTITSGSTSITYLQIY